MQVRLLVVTTLAAAIAACTSSEAQRQGGGATPYEGASVAPGNVALAGINPEAAAMSPKVFADTAAASDMFQIVSSSLAKARASNQATRSFAEMMIAEHTQSTRQLASAAAAAKVPIDPQLSSAQEADLTDLKAAGGRFDTVYAEKQIVAHTNALIGLRKYAAEGTDASLRAFAALAVPVVERHLAQAKKLARRQTVPG